VGPTTRKATFCSRSRRRADREWGGARRRRVLRGRAGGLRVRQRLSGADGRGCAENHRRQFVPSVRCIRRSRKPDCGRYSSLPAPAERHGRGSAREERAGSGNRSSGRSRAHELRRAALAPARNSSPRSWRCGASPGSRRPQEPAAAHPVTPPVKGLRHGGQRVYGRSNAERPWQ